jgi:hypothetical protein
VFLQSPFAVCFITGVLLLLRQRKMPSCGLV